MYSAEFSECSAILDGIAIYNVAIKSNKGCIFTAFKVLRRIMSIAAREINKMKLKRIPTHKQSTRRIKYRE